MATPTPKKIHLIGSGRTEEALGAATIKPGHLLKMNSSGQYIPHSVAGGASEALYADIDSLQGKTVTDSYASGDRVTAICAQKGDVIYAWLSGGETVTPADYLTSNGDGALKKATGTDVRIAAPVESVDASDSNDVDERIKIRVL